MKRCVYPISRAYDKGNHNKQTNKDKAKDIALRRQEEVMDAANSKRRKTEGRED